jgi:capsular polysaccharide biosynthesis protein
VRLGDQGPAVRACPLTAHSACAPGRIGRTFQPSVVIVDSLRNALRPRSGRIQLGELDRSSASAWGTNAAVTVAEVAPSVDVPRQSALVEVVLQAGIRSASGDDSPSYTAPGAHVLRIENGLVETRMCVPFSRELGFVRSSIRKNRTLMEKHGYAFADDTGELIIPPRPKCSVKRPALHLALPFRDNYFHWLIESLGQFLITRHVLPPDVVLAVRPNSHRSPFTRQIFATVGADDAIYEPPQDHVVAFQELYIAPTIVTHQYYDDPVSTSKRSPAAGHTGGRTAGAIVPRRDRRFDLRLHPSAVRAVRELAPQGSDQSKRLYVRRQNRRPSNDAEVLATLGRYGFSEVVGEDLSVLEQMELFAEAEVVVGAHGAGLANTVFCGHGTTVIDLQSTELNEGEQNVYWNLAAVCGLRYIRIVCRALEPGKRRSDFYVDCRNLEEVVRREILAL